MCYNEIGTWIMSWRIFARKQVQGFNIDRLHVASFCACSPIFFETSLQTAVTSHAFRISYHLLEFFCVANLSIRASLSLSFAVSTQDHLSLTFVVAAEVRGCGDGLTTSRLETTAPGHSGGVRAIWFGGDNSWRLIEEINEDGDRCNVSQ